VTQLFYAKPVEVQAMKYDGANLDEIKLWIRARGLHQQAEIQVWDDVQDEWIQVPKGYWIVKQESGLRVIADDVFERMYGESKP